MTLSSKLRFAAIAGIAMFAFELSVVVLDVIKLASPQAAIGPARTTLAILAMLFFIAFMSGFWAIPKKDSHKLLKKTVIIMVATYLLSGVLSIMTYLLTDLRIEDELFLISSIVTVVGGAAGYLLLGAALLKMQRFDKLAVTTGVTSVVTGIGYLSYLLAFIGGLLSWAVYVLCFIMMFRAAKKYRNAP